LLPSVHESIYHQITGLAANNKLNITSKVRLWINLIYSIGICLEGLKKILHSSRQ